MVHDDDMVRLMGTLPIRKIDPTTVALSTYFGKNFVTRGRRKSDSSTEFILRRLESASLGDDPVITRVAPGEVFDSVFVAPYIYGAIGSRYKLVVIGKYTLMFNPHERESLVSEPSMLGTLETDGRVVVGRSAQGNPIVIDQSNEFWLYDLKTRGYQTLGTIYDLMQITDLTKVPVDFTEVRIFAKTVPVAVALGYLIGWHPLLKLLDVKYRTVTGRTLNLTPKEYGIRFKDVAYVFDRTEVKSSLIISGLLAYEKLLRQYDVADFDHRDVHLNLLASKGLGSLYIRELEISDQLFVDPVSRSILSDMHEPQTFRGLLVRASEMLADFHHPDPQDMSQQRIRGYGRISGFVYKELVTSIRSFRNRNISGRSKIELSPYEVFGKIMKDPTIKLPEDINPIQNLKESEVVTYVGEGGRGKESMSAPTRAYHPSDRGVISEGTVDSSDVGVNTYLSANPNFVNLRGQTQARDETNSANLLTTSTNLAVGSTGDSVQRLNFVGIQNSHVIAAVGYHQPCVRTGYESVIGSRTSSMFCYNARDTGRVVSKSKTGIIIEYANGNRQGITLGRIFGKAEGSIYPHDIVSTLDVGDTFVKGDTIAYNTGFFEPDWVNPKSVIYKGSMLVKTVLWESNQTFEDSSSISQSLSKRMTAYTTKLKTVTVEFKQNLIDVVKVGQSVHPKEILMTIEDEITSTTTYFDADSLATLRKLSKQTPMSSYEGTIDRIEVFYHGDLEDMSASLRAIATDSDRHMAQVARSSGTEVITGRVDDSYRVQGKSLAIDHAEIRIYITVSTQAGVGDFKQSY